MRAVEGPFVTMPCKQLHQSSGKTLNKISTENTIIVEVSIGELCQIVQAFWEAVRFKLERLYLITITVEFKTSPWRCLVFM